MLMISMMVGWCFNAMPGSLATFMATNKFKCYKTAILKAIQCVKKLVLDKNPKMDSRLTKEFKPAQFG